MESCVLKLMFSILKSLSVKIISPLIVLREIMWQNLLIFFPQCKKLKPDAVPTLINTSKGKKGQESKKTARSNYLKLQQKRERAKVRKSKSNTK